MKIQNPKLSVLFGVMAFSLAFTSIAFAQTTKKSGQNSTTPSTATTTTATDSNTTTSTDVKSALDDYKKAATAKRLEALKKVGNKMIDVRVKDKNNIKTRITNNKCLAETDKNTVLADITATIDGLTSLKTKIDAATKIDEIKSLVHSIRTDYRVYMVEIPREHGLVAVCRAEAAKKRFDDLAVKIQAEINKAKNNGKDTTTAQAKLDEAKGQLIEAGNQMTIARDKFTTMKVANGDSTNKELRTSAHTALKASHQALQNAKKLFAELKVELKKLLSTTASPE